MGPGFTSVRKGAFAYNEVWAPDPPHYVELRELEALSRSTPQAERLNMEKDEIALEPMMWWNDVLRLPSLNYVTHWRRLDDGTALCGACFMPVDPSWAYCPRCGRKAEMRIFR